MSAYLESSPRLPETRIVDLGLCSLNIMEAGHGEPLIIVPATLSELDNWRDLVRFMGQWFHAHFFELPGHGKSSPLQSPFSSELVSEAVEQLVDALGAERFSLMGFSFGGILAMKTYARLQHRIDRLILLAPCLTGRALQLSSLQRWAAVHLNTLLQRQRTRDVLYGALRSRAGSEVVARIVNLIGRVENKGHLAKKLRELRPSVLEIVSRELDEILGIELPAPAHRHTTSCYFVMSSRDPLLSYQLTLAAAQRQFERVHVTTLDYPYHQPPKPFTLDELNRAFGSQVERFLLDDGIRLVAPSPSLGWAAAAPPAVATA